MIEKLLFDLFVRLVVHRMLEHRDAAAHAVQLRLDLLCHDIPELARNPRELVANVDMHPAHVHRDFRHRRLGVGGGVGVPA